MTPTLSFDNTYARSLPGFHASCRPATVPQPLLLCFNRGLAEELRLDLAGQDDAALAAMFSGNALPEGAQPIAQAYSGHQFGHFNPQLGDGRALLIGEVMHALGIPTTQALAVVATAMPITGAKTDMSMRAKSRAAFSASRSQ